MSYSNGKITAPVSIYDVQRAIAESSNDIGTLCRSLKINKWARYRPTVCTVNNQANNTPNPLSYAQREAERWGFDLIADSYGADGIQPFETYVNNYFLDDSGDVYDAVRMKSWYPTAFCRLTDFVKTDVNGNAVNNIGYDHKAKPTNVFVTHNGIRCQVAPLIPEEYRELYIEAGKKEAVFEFPKDKFWIPTYIDFLNGELESPDSVEMNEEHISVIDLISKPTIESYKNVNMFRRGVMVFEWIQQGVNSYWHSIGRCYDRDGTTDPTVYTRYFDQNPEAFLDLTDTSNTAVGYGDMNLRTLEGRYLFMEYWYYAPRGGGEEITPILGLTYTVNIHRSAAPTPVEPQHVYITSVFVFALPPTPSVTVANDSIVFTCVIYPSAFLRSDDILYDNTDYADRNAELISTRLMDFFDSISLMVGTMTFNLFININEAYVVRRVDDWIELDLQVYADEQGQLDPREWTAEINAMVKQQVGDSIQGHDDLTITT